MIVIVAELLLLILTGALTIYFNRRFFRHLYDDRVFLQAPYNVGNRTSRAARVPVSVLICAKNEARNLEQYLPAVLHQAYRFGNKEPAFEVIVVDDASTDDSAIVLERFRTRYSTLRVVTISAETPRTLPGKKFALSQGLEAAQHEIIVCTDADCRPASKRWLHYMVAPFLEGKSIVAGYGGYNKHPGWLNWFVRYETMHTFVLYAAFWSGGAPYMAVGRNMAARKEIFYKAQQQPQWAALPSGDDDLLIQLCGTPENMSVVAHWQSATWSEPKRSFADYISQKRRHVSTGKFYNRSSKNLLAAYALLRLLRFLLLPNIILLLIAHLSVAPAWGNYSLGLFPISAFIIFGVGISVMLGGGRFRGALARMDQRTTTAGWIAFFFCWLLYNAVLAPWILWKTKQRWT